MLQSHLVYETHIANVLYAHPFPLRANVCHLLYTPGLAQRHVLIASTDKHTSCPLNNRIIPMPTVASTSFLASTVARFLPEMQLTLAAFESQKFGRPAPAPIPPSPAGGPSARKPAHYRRQDVRRRVCGMRVNKYHSTIQSSLHGHTTDVRLSRLATTKLVACIL